MSRDPKIDPAPGDVLCAVVGARLLVVDAASAERVTFRLRDVGLDDKTNTISLDDWRVIAARTPTTSIAERVATLEDERVVCAARLAEIERRIAFLRGAT